MEMEKKRGPFYFFRPAWPIVGGGVEERAGPPYAAHLLLFRHSHGGTRVAAGSRWMEFAHIASPTKGAPPDFTYTPIDQTSTN